MSPKQFPLALKRLEPATSARPPPVPLLPAGSWSWPYSSTIGSATGRAFHPEPWQPRAAAHCRRHAVAITAAGTIGSAACLHAFQHSLKSVVRPGPRCVVVALHARPDLSGGTGLPATGRDFITPLSGCSCIPGPLSLCTLTHYFCFSAQWHSVAWIALGFHVYVVRDAWRKACLCLIVSWLRSHS